MTYIHAYWERAKKILKLMWRHCFTLIILSIGFSAFIEGPVNWKNGFWMTVIAVFFDWAKQYMHLIPSPNRDNEYRTSSIQPFRKQLWDSSLRGTPAYFLRNMDSNRYN